MTMEMQRRSFLLGTAGAGTSVLAGWPAREAVAATSRGGESLALVRNGMADSTILWFGDKVAKFAAEELQDYVEKASGALIRVREAVLKPGDAVATVSGLVVTGGSRRSTMVPAGWLEPAQGDLDDRPKDAFTLHASAERMVLAGQGGRGALYAVYALLERLGVRFFAPSFGFYEGHAEYVPELSTISIPRMRHTEQPSWELRRRYVEEGYSHSAANLPALIDWMAKHRLNVLVYPYDYIALGVTVYDEMRAAIVPDLRKRGITIEVGGHGYDSFLSPDKYPEYYTSGSVVFDLFNDDAVAAYVSEVVAYLRERPEIGIFDCWPPDVWSFPQEILDHFGSPSNAESHVVNALTAAMGERLPGVQVERIAYASTISPPDPEYASDPDVIVDFAPILRNYLGPLNDPDIPSNISYAHTLAAWRAAFAGRLAMYEYYRRYRWRSLPVHPLTVIGNDVAYEETVGVHGIGMYSEPADWIQYELVQSLLAALSWNTALNVSNYVRTYFQERFGAAAGAMDAYYQATSSDPDAYAGRDGIAAGLADYRSARDALGNAAAVAQDPAAAFVVERLTWNIEIAITDLNIGWYELTDPDKVAGAQARMRDLFVLHRFDGIALPNIQAQRRWGASVGNGLRRELAAAYRSPAYGFATETVELTPAGSVGLTISAQDVDHQGHVVVWSVSAPAGLTLSRTSGELRVDGSGIATKTLTLAANPDASMGNYQLAITFRTEDGQTLPQAKTAVRVRCDAERISPDAVTYVDSEETAAEDGAAGNAIDGDPSTIWHTQWSQSTPDYPHEIRVDLGAHRNVCGFYYLPRQAGSSNGTISQYEIYLSDEAGTWEEPAAAGTFEPGQDEKWVPLTETTARYVRLVALSEVNGGPWAAAAEISVDATPAR